MGRKKIMDKPAKLPITLEKNLIACSADFLAKYLSTECFKEWSLHHKKLFALFLNEIDWKTANSNIIELDNKHIADEFGWDYSETNDRCASARIRTSFQYMANHSGVNLYAPAEEKWLTEPLIIHASGNSMQTTVIINPHFMPHFEKLYEYIGPDHGGFFTLLVPDIMGTKTDAGHNLLAKLRTYHRKSGCGTYTHVFKTKELKDIFGLSIGDYMRVKISENEYKDFNRTEFEKKCLQKALLDVDQSEMIRIVKNSDGSLYEKIKFGKKVDGYKITWRVYDNETMKKIRQKKLDALESQIIDMPCDFSDQYNDVVEVEDDYSILF